MGLKDLKKLEREKEIENFLLSYGITKQDLTYLHEALQIVKEKKTTDYVPQKMTETEKKNLEEYKKNTTTPQQLIDDYAKSVERFYPNGDKPKSKTNNN